MKETIKPQHDGGSATRTLFPCPTPCPEYPIREFQALVNKLLSPVEKPLQSSLTPLSGTKLNTGS